MCSVTILAQARGGLSQFGVFLSRPVPPESAGRRYLPGGFAAARRARAAGVGVGGTSPNHRKLEELLCASPVGHTVAPHAE